MSQRNRSAGTLRGRLFDESLMLQQKGEEGELDGWVTKYLNNECKRCHLTMTRREALLRSCIGDRATE